MTTHITASVLFFLFIMHLCPLFFFFFFFNDTATTEIYTLSLHDALPILKLRGIAARGDRYGHQKREGQQQRVISVQTRSEEHTSELQSHLNLVCRLLLEKKKKQKNRKHNTAQTTAICLTQ